MNEIVTQVLPLVIKLIALILFLIFTKILLPLCADTLIPWLKEKRLDGIIKKYVEAAEKLAASGQLITPKKEYVATLLQKRGIGLTDEVDAAIESAVIELDHASAQALFLIHEALEQPDNTSFDTSSEQESQPG